MQIIDVVNDCLESLGETPLNSLSDPHAFKGAALRGLEKYNEEIQATGWWFNEEQITLSPSPLTGHLTLPGDVRNFRSGTRDSRTLVFATSKPWLVERGNRIYDTRNRTYVHTEDVTGEVIRILPVDQLPSKAAAYVSAYTVLRFQSSFDGDSNRRQELAQHAQMAKVALVSEDIRQRRVNAYDNNPRLQRIKQVTQRLA